MRGAWRIRGYLQRGRERRARRLANAAVARFPTVSSKSKHGLSGELIVSLTSYPPRYPTLAGSLRSLLDQDVAADRTILWLAEGDQHSLPKDVLDLVQHGLEIRTCEDWRSYKKLVPALIAFPEATIVTADDDVYYAPHWLGQLVRGSLDHPGDVIGQRVHMALLDENGIFRSYNDWEFATDALTNRALDALIFPTGVGGVLYPPHSLDPLIVRSDEFLRLCPSNDDIWFFWMAKLAGTAHRGLGNIFEHIEWEGSQDVGLIHQNLTGSNDRQFAAMEDHFGKVGDLHKISANELT
jgi:hypothetical protein